MSSYTLFVLRYSNFVKWVFAVCSANKKRQFVMSKDKLLFLTKHNRIQTPFVRLEMVSTENGF